MKASNHDPYRRLVAAVLLRAARDAHSLRVNPDQRQAAADFLADPEVRDLLRALGIGRVTVRPRGAIVQ